MLYNYKTYALPSPSSQMSNRPDIKTSHLFPFVGEIPAFCTKNTPSMQILCIFFTKSLVNSVKMPTFALAKTERWRNWQTRYFEGVVSIVTWEFESPPLHSAKGNLLKRRFPLRGNSSVGRAQPCQGWGREFESRFPLTQKQSKPRFSSAFSILRSSNGGRVDTRDLTSLGQKRLCGFESRFEHGLNSCR